MALSHRLDFEFLDQDKNKIVLWKIDVDSKEQSKSDVAFHTLGKNISISICKYTFDLN